jgi:hypothetical protein
VTNHRQRLVLEMLADAGEYGHSDPAFIARFVPELLDLVGNGFATAVRETRISCGRPLEVACVRITEEGWRAIGRVDGSAWPLNGFGCRLSPAWETALKCGARRSCLARTCGPEERRRAGGQSDGRKHAIRTNCTEAKAWRAHRLH